MKFDVFAECLFIGFHTALFVQLTFSLNCAIESSDPRCSKDANFIGCYRRNCLEEKYNHSSNRMDMNYCFRLCNDRHYILAGLFNGHRCLCGCSLSCNESLSDAQDQCGIPCAGDVGDFCGGRKAVQTYTVRVPSANEEVCKETEHVGNEPLTSPRTLSHMPTTTPRPSPPPPLPSSSTATSIRAISDKSTTPSISRNHASQTSKSVTSKVISTDSFKSKSSNPNSESTSSVNIPMLSSLVGVTVILVVVIVFVAMAWRKMKSGWMLIPAKEDGTIGKKRKGSSPDTNENLEQLPGYQFSISGPPLPVRPLNMRAPDNLMIPQVCQDLRLRSLGDAKLLGQQHRNLLDSEQLRYSSTCRPESCTVLKGDDPRERHIYCDLDDIKGPFLLPDLPAVDEIQDPSPMPELPVGEYVEARLPDGYMYSKKITLSSTDPADPDKSAGETGTASKTPDIPNGKSSVDDCTSEEEEEKGLDPTYDTSLPVCRARAVSSVYLEYETKIPEPVPEEK